MRYFVSNAAHPLKYLSSGNLISKQNFLHQRRNIDTNVLIVVKEGTLYIAQNGVNYKIGPNQYIFLKANENHVGYRASSGKLSYLWVHFLINDEITTITDENYFNDMSERNREDPKNKIYIIPEHGEIAITQRAPLLFNQLLDLSRQEIIYSDQMADYALSLLIMEISQEFIETHQNIRQNIPPNIVRIMEWIKANYYRMVTVTEIAQEFGYNSDYLSTLFKKSTNSTIIHYINKTRIEIAKVLMSAYDLSVKEVAYSCGFSDEKYFMKTFKRLEGMTPSQYKKAFSRKMIN